MPNSRQVSPLLYIISILQQKKDRDIKSSRFNEDPSLRAKVSQLLLPLSILEENV